MKHFKLGLLGIVSALFVVCASVNAFAETSSFAYAVFDYDTFSITSTGDGSQSIADLTAYAEIEGSDYSGSPEAYLQGTSTEAWGEVNVNEADAEYQDLYSHAYVEAPDVYEYAYASTTVEGTYTATTDGTLTISIDYYLGIEVGADAGDIAGAWSAVTLTVGNEELYYDLLDFTAYNDLSKEDETPWYTIEVSVDILADQTICFTLTGESYADAGPVPVPGTGLLLGAGLFVLAAIRRRD